MRRMIRSLCVVAAALLFLQAAPTGHAQIVGGVPVAIVLGKTAAWTPQELVRSGQIVAWWDAAQGETVSAGAVSAWADRVGGATLAQATGSLQPTFSATGVGGQPGVVYDATDDLLEVAPVPAAMPTGSTSGWGFAVVDQRALGADGTTRQVAAYGSTAAAAGRGIDRNPVTSVGRARAGNSSVASTETTVDFFGVHAVTATWTSATLQIRIDGVDGTAQTGLANNTATTRLRVGGGLAGGSTWNGAIGDLIYGTGTLSLSDQQKLEGWALWKTGQQSRLPADHPYRYRRP